MIVEDKGLTYEERLVKSRLTTLETRRSKADLLEVYKIMNGIDGLKVENYFELWHGTRTRRKSLKLFKTRYRRTMGGFSFGNRVVDEWNRLPDRIVKAASVNQFKRHLENHLRNTRGIKKSIFAFTPFLAAAQEERKICRWQPA